MNSFTKKTSSDLENWDFNAEVVNIGESNDNNISGENTSGEKLAITTSKAQKLIIKQENENDLLFCISVDGSKHSDTAFEILTKEFFQQSSKMLVVHVYNEKANHLYNYANKKETVIETYANKIHRYGKQANFIVEDRKVDSGHALEQVNHIGQHFKANFLMCGYYGIKGPKGDNKELSKGVSYLLGNSKLPTIITKDMVLRNQKPSNGYNWLIVFDKQFHNTIRCLNVFLPLIDKKNDFVYGLTMMPTIGSTYDDVKDDFAKSVENNQIANFEYECVTYSNKTPSTYISEKVNFGKVHFDFVVFYNNREKFRNEGVNSDINNIVIKPNCSVCFFNF